MLILTHLWIHARLLARSLTHGCAQKLDWTVWEQLKEFLCLFTVTGAWFIKNYCIYSSSVFSLILCR
jgi:hypothetical protein